MDALEQARRWANAREQVQAAHVCYDHALYGKSVTRSYYACYQAMWAAVGDFGLAVVQETLQTIAYHTGWAL